MVKGIFSGLRPVVIGLIASAAILLMNKANFTPQGTTGNLVASIAICAAALCLVYFPYPWRSRKIKRHPISIIILAGIAGFLLYYPF